MSEIDNLLQENRRFPPPDAWTKSANITDPEVYERAAPRSRSVLGRVRARARVDPAVGRGARRGSRRTRAGSSAASSTPAPTASIATSARRRRNKAAIIWEGEPGDRRTLTYWDLYRQVSAFANVLKSLGVKRGDRVALYLPLIPELAIAMLACARIGAVHSVVFGGFSAESLRDRINDSQCVAARHRRRRLPPRPASCRSSRWPTRRCADTPSIKHVVVVQRQPGAPIPVHDDRRAATTGITG